MKLKKPLEALKKQAFQKAQKLVEKAITPVTSNDKVKAVKTAPVAKTATAPKKEAKPTAKAATKKPAIKAAAGKAKTKATAKKPVSKAPAKKKKKKFFFNLAKLKLY